MAQSMTLAVLVVPAPELVTRTGWRKRCDVDGRIKSGHDDLTGVTGATMWRKRAPFPRPVRPLFQRVMRGLDPRIHAVPRTWHPMEGWIRIRSGHDGQTRGMSATKRCGRAPFPRPVRPLFQLVMRGLDPRIHAVPRTWHPMEGWIRIRSGHDGQTRAVSATKRRVRVPFPRPAPPLVQLVMRGLDPHIHAVPRTWRPPKGRVRIKPNRNSIGPRA